MKREFYVITNRKLSLSSIARAFLRCAIPDVNMTSDELTAGIRKHNGMVKTA
jgi:hypothetical protein